MLDGELLDETAQRPGLSRMWLGLGLGSLILLVAMTSLVAFNLSEIEATPAGSEDDSVTANTYALPSEALSPSVRVVGLSPTDEPICGGSGTIVTPAGLVLTSSKIVTASPDCDFQSIGIAVANESGEAPVLAYKAQLISTDPALDVAVLRIVANISDGTALSESFPAPTLGNSDEVAENDEIQLAGFPSAAGEPLEVVDAKVVGFAQRSGVPNGLLLQTDSASIEGFAGATATDSSGRIVGVVGSSTANGDACLDLPSAVGATSQPAEDVCRSRDEGVNIVRPINLALPILEAAGNAEPLDVTSEAVDQDLSSLFFTNPRFSIGETDDRPTEVVRTAVAGAQELCLFADWSGMSLGISWDAIWYVDGTPRLDYSLRDEVWTSPEDGEDFWVCAVDQEGLEAGLYEIGFFIGDENIFAEGFELAAEEKPVHPVTWTNDADGTTDICSLAVNPKGSGPVGLNELPNGEPIKPGESVVLEVAEGTIVAAADDCEGTRLAIQLDGLVVDGPKDFSIGIN